MCAVVGVEGTIRPIRDLLELLALGRGVTEGKGKDTGLDVRVIAEGVHVEKVGEGGKTNSVWEGVCKIGLWVFGACGGCTGREAARSWRDAGFVARDSLRDRGMAIVVGVGAALTGESGTVGKISRGVGRRLVFDAQRREVSKFDLKAVAEAGGNLNVDIVEGADGGPEKPTGVGPASPSLETSDGA